MSRKATVYCNKFLHIASLMQTSVWLCSILYYRYQKQKPLRKRKTGARKNLSLTLLSDDVIYFSASTVQAEPLDS